MIAQAEAPLAVVAAAGAQDGAPAAGEGAGQVPDALSLKALLISRASLYALFHKLLGGVPNQEALAELLSDEVADMVDEYSEDETMHGLGAFLAELRGRDAAELLDAARDEYTRTFIGPAELPALPYEAPYLSHDSAVFQESTLAVRTWYRRFGLLPKRYLREPDDHVAIMCGFMARLAQGALEAFDKGDAQTLSARLADQRSFVANHLCDWLPEYAVALRCSKTSVLYPQLTEALSVFVRQDVAFAASAEEWLDQAAAGALVIAGEEPASFAKAVSALERISALRPFGIEDNELAPEDRAPGGKSSGAASACA